MNFTSRTDTIKYIRKKCDLFEPNMKIKYRKSTKSGAANINDFQ